MAEITRRRWLRAVRRVWAIERSSSALSARRTPRQMACDDRHGWATPAGHKAIRRRSTASVDEYDFRAPTWCTADGVLIGKFDVAREVRLRAFYVDPGLTAKFQSGGKKNGVTRSVDGFLTLARHEPTLMPEIIDHGRVRYGAYLVERTVTGRPARTSEFAGWAERITRRLFAAQSAHGVGSTALGEVLHPEFLARWDTVAEMIEMPTAIRDRVIALVRRGARLETSMTHGDLVASNVMVTRDDFRLIDWEYAGAGPIAFDLAKLEINAEDPPTALAGIVSALDGAVGGAVDHYSLEEQIALGHARFLTWHPGRAQRAAAAGREKFLARNTDARVEAIEQLLG